MRRLLLSILLLPCLCHADGSIALSLADAEALWQQHSREIMLAQAAVTGAAADVRVAGQRPNPDVSLNVLSISPWSGYGAGGWSEKKLDTVLRIDQLVERGGKRDLRIKGAESRLEASRFDLDDTARQQLGVLRYAYYNLRLAQEKLVLAHETDDLVTLGDGLGQGDHLSPAGKILIWARQRGVLGGRMPAQHLLPVRLVVDGGVKTELAGGHPGVEIDEVVRTGEVDPGHVLVQQLSGVSSA